MTHMKNNNRLLIIFVRNPVLGKVKTRMASKVGKQTALKIYLQLLEQVSKETRNLPMVREVHYSEVVPQGDMWDGYNRKLQQGTDLGERMYNAFRQGFKEGYKEIILIGSDLPDLKQEDIESGFSALHYSDYVIGPAVDGGYYLIGMKSLNSKLFNNKTWGSNTVLEETLRDIKHKKTTLLQERHDLDTFEDLSAHPRFQQYINYNNDKINTGDH